MRLMRPRRIWQLKLLFTGCALAALIIVGGRSLAQMRQLDQSDRDERRLERKVEKLQEAYDAQQLSIEKRLTTIETQISNGISMLYALGSMVGVLCAVIGGYLIALLGRGLRDWLAERRSPGKNGHGG